MARKMVFLELNEVPWQVFDAFCAARPESAFARLRSEATQLSTLAPDRGGLHPWSTWPTLHRGVSNETHGIDHFGQDTAAVDREYPPIWQILAQAGISCGVFGVLHTYPLPQSKDSYAFLIPDTFAAGSECHPAELECFQVFNLSMARASTRSVSGAVDWRAAARFLARAPSLGLKASTAFALMRQLFTERSQPYLRARRRSYQSVLAFDLYEKLLRRTRPTFSNFFTNHVASSMHRYWAARFPEDFPVHGFTDEWLLRFRDEIDFSMSLADNFVARLMKFIERDPDYLLVVASSMGQGAADADPIRSQLYLRNVDQFASALGLERTAWSRKPAMDPDVALQVEASEVERFRSALESIRIDGQSLKFEEKESGFFSMAFGQRNLDGDPEVRIGESRSTIQEVGLVNEVVEDEAASSGYHVPEGLLLILDRRGQSDQTVPKVDSSRREVSTLDIAPYVLDQLGVDAPSYMNPTGMVDGYSSGL